MPLTQLQSFDATILNPLGFVAIAGTGAAQGLGTIPAAARVAVIQSYGGTIGTDFINWRDDGSNPTAAAGGGLRLIAGDTLEYNGDLAAFRWIESTVTGIVVAFYS